jgi:hypothetical protein
VALSRQLDRDPEQAFSAHLAPMIEAMLGVDVVGRKAEHRGIAVQEKNVFVAKRGEIDAPVPGGPEPIPCSPELRLFPAPPSGPQSAEAEKAAHIRLMTGAGCPDLAPVAF